MAIRKPLVGIVMGSESDLPVMEKAKELLESRFGIQAELEVMSAHRAPEKVSAYAKAARERGLKVLIAGAGWAAPRRGVVPAHTRLPVIGVPLLSEALGGADALYSCVQMPPGVPVATVAIGGAKNAAILAAQIIGTADEKVAEKIREL